MNPTDMTPWIEIARLDDIPRLGARVVRTDTFDHAQLEAGQGGPTLRYQEEPHRVLRLGAVLGLTDAPLAERFSAVIVRHGREELVLAVDGLVGQQDAVVKPLGRCWSASRA